VSSIPTLFEELNRKSVDALTWLAEGEESGELRPDQVYVARQALFMALAGLLSSDVNELLSASMPDEAPPEIEVWLKDDRAMSVLVRQGNKRVTASLATIGKIVSHRGVDTGGSKETIAALKGFRKHLKTNGYESLAEHSGDEKWK
jgi:hypothetical protein